MSAAISPEKMRLPIRFRYAQWGEKRWVWYTLATPFTRPVPRGFLSTHTLDTRAVLGDNTEDIDAFRQEQIYEPEAEEVALNEAPVNIEMVMIEQDYDTLDWWIVIVIFWHIGYRHSPPVDLTPNDFLDDGSWRGPRICRKCDRTQLPAEIKGGAHKMLACKRCHQSHYCTEVCATVDWPQHSKSCVPTDSSRLRACLARFPDQTSHERDDKS